MFVLKNKTTGTVLADRIVRPRGWYRRTLGLLDRKRLAGDEGLWLDRCWGVHTVGMRFAIDVLFLDDAFRVLAIRTNVRSGCFAVTHGQASHVVELPAGTCERFDLLPNDAMVLAAAGP